MAAVAVARASNCSSDLGTSIRHSCSPKKARKKKKKRLSLKPFLFCEIISGSSLSICWYESWKNSLYAFYFQDQGPLNKCLLIPEANWPACSSCLLNTYAELYSKEAAKALCISQMYKQAPWKSLYSEKSTLLIVGRRYAPREIDLHNMLVWGCPEHLKAYCETLSPGVMSLLTLKIFPAGSKPMGRLVTVMTRDVIDKAFQLKLHSFYK